MSTIPLDHISIKNNGDKKTDLLEKSVSKPTPAKRDPRAEGDLSQKLLDQLEYIDASAELFDKGKEREAVRLATQIRILVHDGASPSLLSILGIKDSLAYIGTAIDRQMFTQAQTERYGQAPCSYFPGEVGFLEARPNEDGTYGYFAPLVEVRFPPESPKAKATPTLLTFDDWWNAPVIETGKMTYFSRKDLISIMANQDGGAHVSEKLDREYAEFRRDDFGGAAEHWIGSAESFMEDRDWKPIQNDPAAASARQIAYELALTLHRYIDTLPDHHFLRMKRQPMYQYARSPQSFEPFFLPQITFISAGAPAKSSQPVAPVISDFWMDARTQLRTMYSFNMKAKK